MPRERHGELSSWRAETLPKVSLVGSHVCARGRSGDGYVSRFRLRKAFAFDHHFDVAGFERLE